MFQMKDSFSGTSFCDLQLAKEIPYMTGFSPLRKIFKLRDFQKSSRRLIYLYVFFIVVCNVWDTELNSGLTYHGSSHFPCGVCQSNVGWDDRALVCDSCTTLTVRVLCHHCIPGIYARVRV